MVTRSSLAGLLAGLVVQAALAFPAAAEGTDWVRGLGLTPGAPLILLPPMAGAVIAVDDRAKDSSLSQTITLAGDAGVKGENSVVVQVTRDGLAPRIDDNDVAEEVHRVLPDIGLDLAPAGLRNTFGSFGAVVGRQGAVACLYAWQRVNLADVWITGHAASPLDRPVAMTVRYRLCRNGVDTAQLIAAVQGAQSGAFPAQDVPLTRGLVGDPLAAAASLGTPQDYSASASFVPPVAHVPKRSVSRHRRGRIVQARRSADPAQDAGSAPAPAQSSMNMPPVPLP